MSLVLLQFLLQNRRNKNKNFWAIYFQIKTLLLNYQSLKDKDTHWRTNYNKTLSKSRIAYINKLSGVSHKQKLTNKFKIIKIHVMIETLQILPRNWHNHFIDLCGARIYPWVGRCRQGCDTWVSCDSCHGALLCLKIIFVLWV